MKRADLRDMSVDQLLGRFSEIALAQHDALLMNDTAKFNRLFDEMEEVEAELKFRAGDQRRILLHLFDHPNPQVRLAAAKATLALAPKEARNVLQKIKDRREYPQALDAGMTMRALDDGVFKPT